jgi:hypothetical protein
MKLQLSGLESEAFPCSGEGVMGTVCDNAIYALHALIFLYQHPN